MGEKRSNADFGENSELGRKRVKMRDLDSVLCSEGKFFFHSVHPSFNFVLLKFVYLVVFQSIEVSS